MKEIKKNLCYTPVIILLAVVWLNWRYMIRTTSYLHSVSGIVSAIAAFCPLILLVLLLLRETFKNSDKVFSVVAIILGVAKLRGLLFYQRLRVSEFYELFVYDGLRNYLMDLLIGLALVCAGVCILRNMEIPAKFRAIFILGIGFCAFLSLCSGIPNAAMIIPNLITSSLYLYAAWGTRGMFDDETREKWKISSQKVAWLIGIVIAMFVIFGIAGGLATDSSTGSTGYDTGYWGSDGYYHPSDKEMENVWNDVNNWMANNW